MRLHYLIILIFSLLFPAFVFAQDVNPNQYYQAKVLEIVRQEEIVLPDGNIVEQQDLKLRILDGDKKDEEVFFYGINSYDVVGSKLYRAGEKVLVVASADDQGKVTYYVTDYVRTNSLVWLLGLFAAVLIVVGRWRGLRSLVALAFTFLVITKFMIPQILSGASPLLITLAGSFFILLIIIYLTEGFIRKSHITIISIFFSLVITILISYFFVGLVKLTGISSEEIGHLVHGVGQAINFQGLLLAGIIIGALGVLDDVVISQVTAVEQIHATDKLLSKKELFKRSYEIGLSHISSMTNTLFLAYAGVSMPLLILFLSGGSAFTSWGQVINNEAIATEIVRTLAGSIGLILSVPISTLISVWWVKKTGI